MKTLKVLIIESDSNVCQRLEDAIAKDDDISMALFSGSKYGDDFEAALVNEIPDVILMGINGPKTEQMDFFTSIRKHHPGMPVLIMTPHNREGAEAALQALKMGAVEYVTKTMSLSGAVRSETHFTERLLPVIKAVPRLNRNILMTGSYFEKSLEKVQRITTDQFEPSMIRSEILVIVGCLGGVPSLYLLLSSLPDNLPVPIVVVQHMPKIYTAFLAEDLEHITGLKVHEAKDGTELKPGEVYIAPGNYHAKVMRENASNVICLSSGMKVKGFRPSIDVMLQSARQLFGDRVLAVYLSGGGQDGIEGAEVVDIAGGQIIIQNKSSSLLHDLPWKIKNLGVKEFPLERLGHEITQRVI